MSTGRFLQALPKDMFQNFKDQVHRTNFQTRAKSYKIQSFQYQLFYYNYYYKTIHKTIWSAPVQMHRHTIGWEA